MDSNMLRMGQVSSGMAEPVRKVNKKKQPFFGMGVGESLDAYQARGRRETGDPEFAFYTSPRQTTTIFKRSRKNASTSN